MVELVGDSSRDGRWALVRLEIEGDRIVGANADGLDRPLEGLTLLEAATVGGDELAVDALANALGPAFTATPDPGRVAVAMSGGVDSAVALLRAGPGAERLGTGHYARIIRHRGRLLLARGTDPAKDQSYMLARLDPRLLERIWFPLGEQTKEETRAEAASAGLAAAGRSESQEACFLAGGDYRDFLQRHGLEAADGRVVDAEGRELGRQD